MSARRILLATLALAACTGGDASDPPASDVHRIVVEIDPAAAPRIDTVPALDEGGGPRTVGTAVDEDGRALDFVVGEIVVLVPDAAALAELRAIDGVNVIAIDDTDPEEGIEVLLRISELTAPDLDDLGTDLGALEPDMDSLRVGSDAAAATLAELARLAAELGLDVSLNDVPPATGIPDGVAREGYEPSQNAFDWPYIKSTAAQQIGLDTAWQMLFHHGKADNRVTVLVVDGGFQPGGDFPSNSIMRKGEWGPAEDWTCTGGAACPYHGTQVALTMVARVDNDWGTAGVAGPFADLVVLPAPGGTFEMLRNVRRVVREEQPDVINLSFGNEVTFRPDATRRRYDRTFRIAADKYGALAFASAGNDGVDVDSLDNLYLPCASEHVICVGGMGVDTTERASGSNYGSDRDDRSVEIYGPFCVYVMEDPATPQNGAAAQGCGTSFASPFVAGVAALLRIADPSLSPGQMEQILYDTAHEGGLGPQVSGHLRRVDAHMAVARTLGVVWTQPVVTITEGGGTFPVEEVLSFAGTAYSYSGERLPIRWHSSIDGWLNETPTTGSIGAVLSGGHHVIQAIAIDRRGFSGVAAVEVEIENEPPVVTIVSPQDGETVYAGTALSLIGYTLDPDPFANQALADDKVSWTIERSDGTVVWEADGHAVATALDAGDYVIWFRGTDPHGATAEDVVDLEVIPLQPGWQPPTATIQLPPDGLRIGVSGGTKPVDLKGLAFGVDGNSIAGERFRWTALSDNGHKVTLCVGSNFPGSGGGGGGFAIIKSCREATVQLGLAPGAVGRTVWAITLEAVDLQGVSVQRSVLVEVVFATG